MRFILIIGAVLLVLTAISVPQFFYTVDETQHAVITRFGEVQRVVSTPGLQTKTPFIEAVTVLDKRLLRIDVPPASMPDAESQFLDIDAYVRYTITDPRVFRENLVNVVTAAQRIGSIVTAEVRAEIGLRTRSEIIGGQITVHPDGTQSVEPLLDEQGLPTREAITRIVKERIQGRMAEFGVVIHDVRIKRADFPQTTQANIFNRMRTERDVQADRLRAEGEEEFLRRTADVDRQVEIISAGADETSSTLRGEGEAEAIRILAQALEQDPELFSFLRSLEAYRLILTSRTTVVLPADSDLFRYLQSSALPPTPTPAP